jgi:hypothetical protein
VGEIVSVEIKVVSSTNGDFHRTRTNLQALVPLARVVTLSPNGSEIMLLNMKYEKIPRFYSFCGNMGHTHLECGMGEHATEELQYGEWMIADEETWRSGTPRVWRNTILSGARDRGG